MDSPALPAATKICAFAASTSLSLFISLYHWLRGHYQKKKRLIKTPSETLK
jgi:hypothetical protein